ncbi:IS701 family transposase [Streptomyces sp. NPDC059340]|uniref:IS701 family transposase n=1 Tax=Streptomyces sp. NPDC059340 TaxID=3346806 RepID=UPI0036785EB7
MPLSEKPDVRENGGSMANHSGLDTLEAVLDVHVSLTVDPDLRAFCTQIFKHLSRVDQRRCAHAYVEALLTTPGKKSIRRLARAISASPAAAQSLRQFVNASPWNWEPVLHELVTWAEGHSPAHAWTIGRAFLPKRGERSVGVHRHYDPTSNRTLNCQLGYGAFLCIDTAYIPVAWELSLPGPWTDDPYLRQHARVPDTQHYRPPWAHVLGLVDTLATRVNSVPLVADLSEDQDVNLLINGLNQRGQRFVIRVPRNLVVTMSQSLGVRQPLPASVHFTVPAQPLETLTVTTPCGGRRPTRIQSMRVHVQALRSGSSSERPFQLFTEMRTGNRPGAVWITNLPPQQLSDAVKLASYATGPAVAVNAMAQWFGLLDFEGRSFPGWHHHMSLVSAAYAYQRLGRSPRATSSEDGPADRR